jgi:hypothetical protein
MTPRTFGMVLAVALAFSALAASASAAAPARITAEEAVAQEAAGQEAAEAVSDAAAYSALLAEPALTPKGAAEYPAYASKIERIRFLIAKYLQKKMELRQLPQSSKRRKRALASKDEKLQAATIHLRDVKAALRVKKEAAR